MWPAPWANGSERKAGNRRKQVGGEKKESWGEKVQTPGGGVGGGKGHFGDNEKKAEDTKARIVGDRGDGRKGTPTLTCVGTREKGRGEAMGGKAC